MNAETIRIKDGTQLKTYGGSSEYQLLLIVDEPDTASDIFDKLTVKNLSKFEFLDSEGEVTATYTHKEVVSASHVKYGDTHVMEVRLKDVDKVRQEINAVAESLDSNTQKTARLENVVDEILIAIVEKENA
mgnify:FL=1